MKSAAVAEPSAHAVEHEDVAARCAVTTLITASTATDVEHLARRIHAASSRAAFSFVQASAAALPVEARALLEQENICLLCAEPAPEQCHRRLVAEYFVLMCVGCWPGCTSLSRAI